MKYTPTLADSYTPPVKSVTVGSIYNKGIPKLADNLEYVAFRLPVAGELVVCTDGSTYTCTSTVWSSGPVLIAQRLKRKVVSFRNTGMTRRAANDWVRTVHGNFMLHTSVIPFEIWEMVESEEDIP